MRPGWCWILVLALAWGCATAPPEEEVPSAEGYYRRALEMLEGRRVLLFFRDVNYPAAIELFQEVIDNYPYSEYATLAELKIADVYFEQLQFEEAASYYQDFVELHPSHPEVPYAIYRNGLCSFEQVREVDRDQTPTHEAVAQFKVLLERYPDSEYAELGRERLREAVDHLAAHDIEVGLFYYKREDYHAAANRFRQALTAYPDHTDRLRTLIRLADALVEMNHVPEAEAIYRDIMDSLPEEGLGDDTENDLKDLEEKLIDANHQAYSRYPLWEDAAIRFRSRSMASGIAST